MSLVQKPAPHFQGKAVVGKAFKDVSLNDYKGKWLVLFFYPLDFTFVCPTEITAFSDAHDKFKKLGAEVVGCSVDSHYTHLAWINTPRANGGLGELKYPLLADLAKKIGSDYGVLLPTGICLRGLFIVNPEGIVQYQLVHDLGVGRNVEEVLRVLEALQQVQKTGEVCPANWQVGGKTIKPDPVKSKEFFQTAAR